ncbi:MAG: hypothetical protein WC366_05520 [Bacilli bacterium]|jgi:bifunctional DNA-binding transcriptional regulator/antitoxin component of YhaV-PrlF toxin-antitoxin module
MIQKKVDSKGRFNIGEDGRRILRIQNGDWVDLTEGKNHTIILKKAKIGK